MNERQKTVVDMFEVIRNRRGDYLAVLDELEELVLNSLED